MNTEKQKPVSMLTASLELIKYNVTRQPSALKPAASFIRQQAETKELVKNTLVTTKIYI
jgi:hypothetical protein